MRTSPSTRNAPTHDEGEALADQRDGHRVRAHAVAGGAAGGAGGVEERRGDGQMIRKIDRQKGLLLRIATRQSRGRWSRWTAQLLIVLALSSLGCARGDWTTETLT